MQTILLRLIYITIYLMLTYKKLLEEKENNWQRFLRATVLLDLLFILSQRADVS